MKINHCKDEINFSIAEFMGFVRGQSIKCDGIDLLVDGDEEKYRELLLMNCPEYTDSLDYMVKVWEKLGAIPNFSFRNNKYTAILFINDKWYFGKADTMQLAGAWVTVKAILDKE